MCYVLHPFLGRLQSFHAIWFFPQFLVNRQCEDCLVTDVLPNRRRRRGAVCHFTSVPMDVIHNDVSHTYSDATSDQIWFAVVPNSFLYLFFLLLYFELIGLLRFRLLTYTLLNNFNFS